MSDKQRCVNEPKHETTAGYLRGRQVEFYTSSVWTHPNSVCVCLHTLNQKENNKSIARNLLHPRNLVVFLISATEMTFVYLTEYSYHPAYATGGDVGLLEGTQYWR